MTKETTKTDKATVKARFIIGSNTEEGKYHGKAFRKNEQGQLVADDCGMDLNCVFACKETQSTLKDLAERLKGADTRYIAFYSVLRTALSGQFYIAPRSRVDEVKKKYHTENVIARTNDYLMYAQGVPGILAIDMDDIPEGEVRKRIDELLELFPFLKEYDRLEFYSSSSNIYDEQGNLVKPPKGVRILFVIDDASKIQQVAQIIYDRLVLAGKGFIKIASDGFMLERSYIDLAIYKVTQPDYICKSEVPFGYEHRKEVTFFEGSKSGQAVPSKLFKKLTTEEKEAVKSNFAIAKRINQAEADRVKAEWLSKRTDAEREMYARFEATQTLSLDWTVYDAKGNPVSVRHMRDNAGEYFGTWFYDPIAGMKDAATGEVHNRSATLRKDDKTGQFYIQSFKGSRKYLIESDKKQSIVDGDWQRLLKRDSNGSIINASNKNAVIIVENMIKDGGNHLRWNDFSSRIEYNGKNLNDRVANKMLVEVEDYVDDYILNQQKLDTALAYVADKDSYHPIKEYLESLEWDGEERIGTWLNVYANVKQTPVVEQMARKFLISMVARVMEPGCQVDTTLMLYQAEGGAGKSTMAKILAGDQKYFLDASKDLSREQNALIQSLSGKWIIELPEMKSVRSADIETVKSFLTTQTDTYRVPYGKRDDDYPRQCVFIATTNKKELPDDPALLRRYLPVEINNALPEDQQKTGELNLDALRRDRDQLMAEAFHCYKNGEIWHFTKTDPLLKEIEEHKRQFVMSDSYVEIIVDQLGNKSGQWGMVNELNLTDVCDVLGLSSKDKTNNFTRSRVKKAMMKVEGWTHSYPKGFDKWTRDRKIASKFSDMKAA